MVRIPTPADPTTGLQGDPRLLMRTLLKQPEPRTAYERKQIEDALARACMDVLSRMEDLEARVEILERRPGKVASVRRKQTSGGGGRAADGKPSSPTQPSPPVQPELPSPVKDQPNDPPWKPGGGGSSYQPREGTTVAAVLQLLQDDGAAWENGEILDALARTGFTGRLTSQAVSEACGILYRKGLLKRARITGVRGRKYRWSAK